MFVQNSLYNMCYYRSVHVVTDVLYQVIELAHECVESDDILYIVH